MQCLHLVDFKNGGSTNIVVDNSFQEGFGHYTDQNRSFKRWKQMEKLWKSWFKWTGHWRAQRNELVVPGQNITFPWKRRLIWMSATDKWGIYFEPWSSWGFLRPFSGENWKLVCLLWLCIWNTRHCSRTVLVHFRISTRLIFSNQNI